MTNIAQNVLRMTLFFIVLSIIFSCAKDSDVLLGSVLEKPKTAVDEEKNSEEEEEDPTNNEEVSTEVEGTLETRTFSFAPTNDAYLQGNQGHDQTIIRLQENLRTSYLMFDLSQVNGSISSAVLQFSIDSDEGDGSITIHKGIDSQWTEENLNENNAPKSSDYLASANKTYKVGSPEKIALDPTGLKAEILTLVLTHSAGDDLAFASKEHLTRSGPKLTITYKAPKDSPLIEQEEEPNTNQEENTAEDGSSNQGDNTTTATEGAYYVTVNGKASNNGKSEANAWSIEHAFKSANAGDVVYIKAGDYGNKELLVANSGTSNKPIKFIGYTNTPGDIVSNKGSTFLYGDRLDASKMPLIRGEFLNDIGTGTGITIREDHILLENFQITKYDTGLFVKANEVEVKNIITSLMGDFSLQNSYPTGTSNAHLNYSGSGIVISGERGIVTNCFALNSGAEGITFRSANNVKANYNKVYADNNINPTDYYFLIATGTTNSTFKNTTVFRVGQLEHFGHGIVMKGSSEIKGNVVDGFNITNTLLEVQFPKVANNTLKNGKIIKEKHINKRSPEVGGIMLSNGSHHNTFENIELTNCSIKFQDWKDGAAGDVNDSSDSNILRQITVKDAFSAIAFSYFQVENHASSADNNRFEECTFSNLNFLFEVDRANSNTTLKNCTVNGVNKLKIERIPGGPTYSLDASYQNVKWFNVNFNPPN